MDLVAERVVVVVAAADREERRTRAGAGCVRHRWYIAGMTLRWARSPVAPNRTSTDGSGTRSRRRPSRRTFSAALAFAARLPARFLAQLAHRARRVLGRGAGRAGWAGRRRVAAVLDGTRAVRPCRSHRRHGEPRPGVAELRLGLGALAERWRRHLRSSRHVRRIRCGEPPAPWLRTNRPGASGNG